MVCLANDLDKYIPSSPKQKLARRSKLIFKIYDEYFRDEEVFQYYYMVHDIDLYKHNYRPLLSSLPELSGVG